MRWIWPTRRGWLLCLGAAYLFVAAGMYGSFVICVFASSAFALALTSLVCALLSLRGLTVRRGPVGEAAAGQAVSMPLIVLNRCHRRRQTAIIREPCRFAADPVHITLLSSLQAREERVVHRRVLTQRRGEYDQQRVIFRGGDPAGLFYRERAFELPQRVVITPAIESLPDFPWKPKPTLVATGGSPLSAAGTSQEVYGIREHHPMDGLRNIHWKSSARFGKLMVREFERDAVMSVAILLDAEAVSVSGPEHWSNFEYQIRAAASIINHVADLYCHVAFGTGGEYKLLIEPALASQVKRDLLYRLAALQPGKVSLADVAMDLGERLPRDSVVFCLSLSMSDALAKALQILALQGMTVRWFCAARYAFKTPETGRATAEVPAPVRQGGGVDLVHLRPGIPLTGALCYVQ